MKKLYLFLFTVLCFAFVSKADVTYKFNFTVEDPENVTIKICDSYDSSKVLKEIDVKEGLNTFEYDIIGYSYANLFVNTTEGKILKAHKEDGTISYDVADNALKISLSPWYYGDDDPEYTYTIKIFDEASFRSHSVKITLDNPEGIKMNFRGIGDIEADKNEYEIPFNDVYEDMLTIRKINTNELIYKITANGNEVVKEGYQYYIPLVDRSDIDDIKYVSDVVITQNFPEDLNYTVKFVFTNGDPDCIKYVTYGGEPVEDFANENGFTVRPGKELYAEFNREDYKIISYQKNDKDPYESSYISIMSEIIGSDFTLTVTAEKFEVYTATIIASNPEQIKMERGYPSYAKIELVAGENQISFKKDGYDDKVTVSALDGFDITRIYDETYDKETVVSTMYSTTIYLDENSKIYIDSEPIVRNDQILIYVDDIMYYNEVPKFSRGGESIPAVNGYQFISYREKDNYITIMASGAYKGKYYKNGVDVDASYFSYYSFSNLVNNDILKLFLNPDNAIEHTVTFDMNEGALDGYEVKKDILAAVDPTQPVSAVGKTQFTIAPISREGSDLTVTVGDKKVEPVDGVYTFETEGDTTVKVTKATSGIENVICGENGTADVYNLQGIRVARQAKAADVNALPAGIYVVNGQKVIVK